MEVMALFIVFRKCMWTGVGRFSFFCGADDTSYDFEMTLHVFLLLLDLK